MAFIDIQNLSFSYHRGQQKVPIFNQFNLKIEKGDFIAIKGPSGSGKSTLLYLIAGLLKIQQGKVIIDGKDTSLLSDLELSELRNHKIGYVFQQFHLLSKNNVKENILLPTLYPLEKQSVRPHKEQEVFELAKKLGIETRLDHLPNELSGGQQQRVAIARALINDADIILADEPTGNLDSKSTEQIINILKELHAHGKTIVLITHEDEVANIASTIYYFKDGQISEVNKKDNISPLASHAVRSENPKKYTRSQFASLIPLAMKNAFRNKVRSLLTMLGITVGVAAVCAMVTLGNFTKERILESYAELGVNTIKFRGHQNWLLKATDTYPVKFKSFSWENDLLPLKKVFPAIRYLSPSLKNWRTTVTYAGESLENDPRLIGVGEDGLRVLNRELIAGRDFSPFHISLKSSVCIIGYDIVKRLFVNTSPLNKIIHVSQDSSTFACKVIGVLAPKTSNNEWSRPNLQVFIPFSVFQMMSEQWWHSNIRNVTIQFYPGADIQKQGEALKKFFENKYGISGRFNIDSDSVLIAQMEKFLSMFSLLLGLMALVTLSVGGVGITNMMLVSVSERLKEIGIRKAIGATHKSIRYQFLLESLFLCTLAGLLGVFIGVGSYQSAIWIASNLIDKLEFEWIFDPIAIGLSVFSIVAVGLLSGLAPALKAEKLQVIEALRSE